MGLSWNRFEYFKAEKRFKEKEGGKGETGCADQVQPGTGLGEAAEGKKR